VGNVYIYEHIANVDRYSVTPLLRFNLHSNSKVRFATKISIYIYILRCSIPPLTIVFASKLATAFPSIEANMFFFTGIGYRVKVASVLIQVNMILPKIVTAREPSTKLANLILENNYLCVIDYNGSDDSQDDNFDRASAWSDLDIVPTDKWTAPRDSPRRLQQE